METNWTPERIEELKKWCEKHINEKKYAKGIADSIHALDDLNEIVRNAYNDPKYSYEEMEIMWKMQERMEKSITMKIKHFFRMVYGNDNTFTRNLKGLSYLDHYFRFKDFVEGPVYKIRIS